MSYLERNAQIVREINSGISSREIAFYKYGPQAHNDSGTTTFTSVGGFHSAVLDRHVPVGLKEYSTPPDLRVINDLTVIATVADTLPTFTEEVPVFIALLEKKSGEQVGILTEDFSVGGRNKVFPYTHARPEEWELPYELAEIIPGISERELAHASFHAGGHRRLGDFTTILSGLSMSERRRRFPVQTVLDRQDEFTVFTE